MTTKSLGSTTVVTLTQRILMKEYPPREILLVIKEDVENNNAPSVNLARAKKTAKRQRMRGATSITVKAARSSAKAQRKT